MAKLTNRDRDILKSLLAAWSEAFGEREITSTELLKRTQHIALSDPLLVKLRDILRSILPFGRKLSALSLGLYLRKHIETEHGGYRLSGTYDSNQHRWNWYVFKISSVEQIESEPNISVQPFIDARKKKLAGAGLEKQLKQLEKDTIELDKQRHADKSDKPNAEAQQAMEKAEEEKAARKHIYLAPASGFFVFEHRTMKRCRELCKLGFIASMGYLSSSRFVIWIDGSPDMKELKRVATRFLMTIFESEQPRATKKARESEQIWDAQHERWLPANWDEIDHTSIRLIRKALELDRPHDLRDPIRLKPIAEVWSPFRTVGCTPRMVSHANADAFDAYRAASREAANFGY